MPTPTFPKFDPATPDFWDARFDAAFTPWDQGGVPHCLSDYVARHPAPQTVLIPGCGAAYEVAFLAEHGWDVHAIDFSPAAVAMAKKQLGRYADRVEVADFFSAPSSGPRYTVIYERAFLCALPRALWQRWADQVAQFLPRGGLLMGFFFFDTVEKGPPFGLASTQLDDLLTPHFKQLEEATPTDSIAIFQGKEQWMVWERR